MSDLSAEVERFRDAGRAAYIAELRASPSYITVTEHDDGSVTVVLAPIMLEAIEVKGVLVL